MFKRWKIEVKNQTGVKVKSLKSDNDEKYDGKEFKDFCSEHEIRMIKTIPGTLEQNGVAKRMNRTLNERARCMQIQSDLPKVVESIKQQSTSEPSLNPPSTQLQQ